MTSGYVQVFLDGDFVSTLSVEQAKEYIDKLIADGEKDPEFVQLIADWDIKGQLSLAYITVSVEDEDCFSYNRRSYNESVKAKLGLGRKPVKTPVRSHLRLVK